VAAVCALLVVTLRAAVVVVLALDGDGAAMCAVRYRSPRVSDQT
jgi:hypothetical protein